MDHGTNYIKIRTALVLNRGSDLTSNGFNQQFMDKLIDYEELFRAQLILPINEAVGLHNWAILFIEFPQSTPKFLADIYTDDKSNFKSVAAIVTDKIRDVEFECFYKGTVNDYLQE